MIPLALLALGPFLAALGVAALLVLHRRPWLAPWLVVPVLAASAELQLRLGGPAGVLKDLVVLAVIAVAGVRILRTPALVERLRSWAPPLGALTVLVALYVLNPLGGHGLDWALSVRLVIEASGLLVAGLVTTHAARSRHHLVLAVAAVASFEAAYAWLQHLVGQDTLIYSWGYQFGAQVRLTSSGGMRVSGTFADPFALAALGVVALCLGLFLARGRVAAVLVVAAVAIAGAASVRTAFLQLGLVGLVWALHRGWVVQAAAVATAGVAAALLAGSLITTAVYPGGPETPLLLGFNGRAEVWQRAIVGPQSFVVGNGVAAIGSGSGRSEQGLVTSAARYDPVTNPASAVDDPSAFLDSAYAQVQSDTGLVGTAALLVWLFGTLLLLVRVVRRPGLDPTLRRVTAGAIALLLASSLDWVGRTTLFAFPTGFLLLFALGLLCAEIPVASRPRRFPVAAGVPT